MFPIFRPTTILRVFALAAFGLILLSCPLKSLQAKPLNASTIEKFVTEMADITSGTSRKSDEDIADYLQTHLADSGQYKTVISYDIPGLPAQKKPLILDKSAFINSALEARHSVEKVETTVEILDTQIDRNGKTAQLTSRSTESGLFHLPPETGYDGPVYIKGITECDQYLGLNKQTQQIILEKAFCATDIKLSPDGPRQPLEDYSPFY